MHSTDVLQGDTFDIEIRGRAVTHRDFFHGLTRTRRLGVVAPDAIDGAGAIAMIMAHVTAFYDDYRAEGGEFLVYPDYFAFVPADRPVPSYGMFDIWPDHKVVPTGSGPVDVLRAVTDRAVNILLVPDGEAKNSDYDSIALDAARRTIDTCYAYAFDSVVRDADVSIACPADPLVEWVQHMFDSVDEPALAPRKAAWLERAAAGDQLVQQYRRIDLDQALRLI